MNLHKLIFTNNECYKWNVENKKNEKPQGLFLHSTGANNPRLSRYIGPDDGYVGQNKYNNHWNQPMDKEVCAHGFIGKAANGEICTYQTLPYNFCGWHSGSGEKGSANYMGYLGFEICEDDLTDASYFNAVYKEAVELFASLAVEYDIKPEKPYIICHSEAAALGIASNHGDVMHWFVKHNKTMDDFRADVAAQMKKIKGEDKKESFKAGDVVQFLGGDVYANANAGKPLGTAKAGPAEITYTYKGKHPYHLVHTDGKSTVYGWVDANTIQGLQNTAPTPTPTPAPTKPDAPPKKETATTKNTFEVGDTVNFKGGSHYVSANADTAASTNRKPGAATISAKSVNSDHPYHLIAVEGKGSNVYGWVDADDIEALKTTPPTPAPAPTKPSVEPTASLKKGDKVRVNKGAKTYSGGGLASYVYNTTYEVIEVKGDRVVIGLKGAVTAAMNIKDLKKI